MEVLRESWKSVCVNCPKLRELRLFGGLIAEVSLRFDRCLKALESLSDLDCIWSGDLNTMLLSLCDISSPLAKCMRRLRINTEFIDGLASEVAGLLVKMLESSQSLEYVELEGTENYQQFFNTHPQEVSSEANRSKACLVACRK